MTKRSTEHRTPDEPLDSNGCNAMNQLFTTAAYGKKILRYGIPVLLVVVALVLRVQHYICLQYEWNQGQRYIEHAMWAADRLLVIHEAPQKSKILGEVNFQSEVRHFLAFLEFEPTAEVSFWRHPMVVEERLNLHKRRYATDSVKLLFFENDAVIGHIWIQPAPSRKITFVPVGTGASAAPGTGFVYGVLTEESYQHMAYWFLSYGIPYYVKTLPVRS